ncbi:hypothetical protein LDENG_00226480, partial [Lucifuga dentata]
MTSGPGPEAAKHDAPSTVLHRGDDVLVLVCGALFTPYVVLRVLPEQFNLSFISPQNIFPVVLWSVKVLFGKLQVCSDVFFGKQQLPPWCPAM